MSEEEAMHAYQYNDSPAVPGFSSRFVRAHLKQGLPEDDVDYVPISGVKPILGLLPLACGCALEEMTVATMTKPGYPIPADWCAYHPKVTHVALPLNSENGFRFAPEDIPAGTSDGRNGDPFDSPVQRPTAVEQRRRLYGPSADAHAQVDRLDPTRDECRTRHAATNAAGWLPRPAPYTGQDEQSRASAD